MAHKYIREIIDLKNTPYGWSENTGRDLNWVEQRRIYGFDERETWALDSSFFYWLYERLRMYDEINCIDTSFHKFQIEDKELTQQECIDEILSLCKEIITQRISDEERVNKQDKVMKIWSTCYYSMWW